MNNYLTKLLLKWLAYYCSKLGMVFICGLSLIFSSIALGEVNDPFNNFDNKFTDENLAYLDVKYERYILGDGIATYTVGEQSFVPLVDVVVLLELNISVKESFAKGWVSGKNQEFLLRRDKNGEWLSSVDNKEVLIESGRITLVSGLIYVDTHLLADWFGVALTAVMQDSLFVMETSKPLPFEKSLKRRGRVAQTRSTLDPSSSPWLKTPYQLVEVPSVDLVLRRGIRKNTVSNSSVSTSEYSAFIIGDAAYMNTQLFISGSEVHGGTQPLVSRVNTAILRMEQFDHTSSMFGALKASQFSVGDLGLSQGRGMLVGNKDVLRTNTTEATIIEGEYHPGWDVELYQNGIVVNSALIDEDGLYAFSDLQLFVGNNRFTLKFYGPGGQEAEEVRNILVGSSDNEINKVKYKLSLSQPNLRTINTNHFNDGKEKNRRLAVGLSYAFNPFFSVNGNFQHDNFENSENIDTGSAGLQASFWNMSFLSRIYVNNDFRLDSHSSINGFLAGYNYQVGAKIYEPNYATNDYPKHDYFTKLSGRLGSVSNNLFFEKRESKISLAERVNLGFGGNVQYVRWSKNFYYSSLFDGTLKSEQSSGQFALHRSFRPLSLNLNLNYGIYPAFGLTAGSLGSSFRLKNNVYLNADTDYDFLDHSSSYSLGFSWMTSYFRLTPSVTYREGGDVSGLITLSASLGKRTNKSGGYNGHRLSGSIKASRGTFKARLFEDVNRNGYYDDSEPLMSGGVVSAVQFRRHGTSNAEGEAWLENIPAWRPTDIIYENDSVSEASMVYSGDEFSIVTRPGGVTAVNMPLVRTASISGHVYRELNLINEPEAGLVIDIFNVNDNIIEQKKVTDSGGRFLFEFLKPGSYRLKIDGEDILNKADALYEIQGDGAPLKDAEIILLEKQLIPEALLTPISIENIITIKEQDTWSVQVASYKSHTESLKLIERLSKNGYKGFIKTITLPRGIFNRVFVGRESNKENLKNIQKKLDKLLKVKSFPVRLSLEMENG